MSLNVLVINCGSSSLKYQLFEMPAEHLLARGLVERIGEPTGTFQHQCGGCQVEEDLAAPDHAAALDRVRAALLDPETGPIDSPDDIGAIGHRVVHGGEAFVESMLIDDAVIGTLEEHRALAPLHNPPNLVGIRSAARAFPGVPQVGVFDTAFHQSMPRHAFLYALPYELYTRDRIRRYGFHGSSHRFVAARAAEMLRIPQDDLNAITCHLGNGCSMAAIAGGRSVDTSLGFTPLEGLVMGTRSGDFDPAILFYLARRRGMSIDALDAMVNSQSGLLGLSGVSNDMRELLEAAPHDERCQLAIDVFCYRVRKYIGAYLAVLGRTDTVVFTGGIGENAPAVRAQILEGLDPLGVALDPEANAESVRCEADVASPDSPVRILVVPTNEELMIARDTLAVATAPAADPMEARAQ